MSVCCGESTLWDDFACKSAANCKVAKFVNEEFVGAEEFERAMNTLRKGIFLKFLSKIFICGRIFIIFTVLKSSQRVLCAGHFSRKVKLSEKKFER